MKTVKNPKSKFLSSARDQEIWTSDRSTERPTIKGEVEMSPGRFSPPLMDLLGQRQSFWTRVKTILVTKLIVVVLLLMASLTLIEEAEGHFVQINFDTVKPGKYTNLTVDKVQFRARGKKGFEIGYLNRKNVSKQVLIIPPDEIVDLSFDKNFGTVTGMGVTVGLIKAGPGERATFGSSIRLPKTDPAWLWQKIAPPRHPPNFPTKTTMIWYNPKKGDKLFSFQVNIDKSESGYQDGIKLHISAGNQLGVYHDDTFEGKPGLGCIDDTGKGGGGAFFDNVTIEVSVGDMMPYLVTGSHADKIDLVFMPDRSYHGRFMDFFIHLSHLIENGFEKNDAFRNNRHKFNIYYMKKEAKINPYVGGLTMKDAADPPSPWQTWGFSTPGSKGFGTDYPFVDAVAVAQIQFSSLGNCGYHLVNSGAVLHFSSNRADVFFHEAGHGLFYLSGEYCTDQIPNNLPYPNTWSTKKACQDTAKKLGWDPSECRPMPPDTWGTKCQSWIFGDDCAMRLSPGFQYCKACMRNVKYYLDSKK